MADDARTLPPGQPRGPATSFQLEGQIVRGFEGEPVAVALYASGIRLLGRSTKYHRPRGMFCASGHCASCLLRIDGKPNLRSCVTPVHAGLTCQRQNAFPDPDIDLLRAADWLFPQGMDHHRLMTGSRLGNELFVKLVRQMGGTGQLPDEPPAALPPPRDETVDVCIVGAGPAGLAAAAAIAEGRPGLRLLVLDDQDRPGGSLLAEPEGVARGAALAAAARARGARLELRATALAYFPEDGPAQPPVAGFDGPPGVLAVARPDGLQRVSARRFLYATGAYDQNLPLPDGDRPGVLAARAVGRLAFRWGVRPGRQVVVAVPAEHAPAAYVGRLVAGLQARGVRCTVVDAGAAEADRLPGGKLDLDEDVLATAALPAPASELPRHHGAQVRFDVARGGFCVVADAAGAAAPGVFAAGDVTGYLGPDAAAEAGRRVAAQLADSLG